MTKSKKYYYNLFNEEIKKIENNEIKPKLLLHACCAPCSSATLLKLIKYFDITILYYNPNISPKAEFEKRLLEEKRLIKEMGSDIKVLDIGYDPMEYFDAVKGLEHLGEKSDRCTECFKLRLGRTAKYAAENGYDYFTTTLTISTHKNSNLINEIMEESEKNYGIKYLPSDFKKDNGFKDSVKLSEKYNLYRQDYCGCIFSKQEREAMK